MKFIADFHIHSPYARAVSKEMTLPNLDAWAGDKGILVMGTGDFTHPKRLQEIKEKLETAEPGLFRVKKEYKVKNLKGKFSEARFILTTELSHIYSRAGRTRRIHHLVFAPNLKTVDEIIRQFLIRGFNLASDGRPILGLDSEELLKIVLDISQEVVVVPAHAWTPWFSVFGSMSGFDSLEECFGDYTNHIFAIETGLSSDPLMNWRLSALDNVSLISNSDSHSLQRIGREANVFDTELSYKGIVEAIKSRDPKRFIETLEFFPEEGKYHYDGHRACEKMLSPSETEKLNRICPVCSRPVTVGVMNRVHSLADRPEGFKDPKRVPYRNMIPLDEIIGEAFGVGVASKRVKEAYRDMIINFGTELGVLFDVEERELRQGGTAAEIIEGIIRVREGKVNISPGYDGEYGKIKIFNKEERESLSAQNTLF